MDKFLKPPPASGDTAERAHVTLFGLGANSVQRKIVLSFLLVMVISVGLILSWVAFLTQKRLLQAQVRKAEIVSTNLAASCAEPMMVGERDRLTLMLDAAKASDPDTDYILLLGNDGKCVASTEPKLVDTYLNKDKFDKQMLAVQRLVRLDNPSRPETFEVALPVMVNETMRMGTLRMGYTTRTISAVIRSAVWWSLWIVVFSIALGGMLFTWLVRRGIVMPLYVLMAAAERLSRGDLTVKTVGHAGSDEIGRLAATFDRMLELLSTMVSRIKHTAGSVADSSQNLAQASREAKATTAKVAVMIGDVTRTVGAISSGAQSANTYAQNTNSLSRQDRELVKRLVVKIENIQTGALKSADAINTLQTHSSRIGEIVQVITAIAAKTNLLSLNATIEAVRAGTAGRSFAVVATQVRKLAESSSASAAEISKLVTQIQKETHSAVQVTEEASHHAEEGGQMMAETDKSLEKILENIENTTSQVAQIAGSVQGLAASAAHAAQASEEQKSVVERVSSSAQSLSDTAAELNSLVERFRV